MEIDKTSWRRSSAVPGHTVKLSTSVCRVNWCHWYVGRFKEIVGGSKPWIEICKVIWGYLEVNPSLYLQLVTCWWNGSNIMLCRVCVINCPDWISTMVTKIFLLMVRRKRMIILETSRITNLDTITTSHSSPLVSIDHWNSMERHQLLVKFLRFHNVRRQVVILLKKYLKEFIGLPWSNLISLCWGHS